MPELVIWGGAGQAKVLAEALRGTDFHIAAIFDNRIVPPPLSGVPVHHGRAGFGTWLTNRPAGSDEPIYFVVAIGGGDGRARLEIGDWLTDQGLSPLSVIHPRAWIAGDATIGAGAQILAGALIGSQAHLGRAVIVNTGAMIDHECVVADGVHVGPGAVLAGEVSVGARAFIGAGSTILPRRRIGADAVIGAGSVVVGDVAPGTVVVGNPARLLERGATRDRQDP